MLTSLEKKIIARIQKSLPIVKHPFLEIANQLGVSEDVLIRTIRKLCREGVIRRFGATIRHQISGFCANAMVAWMVEEDRIDEAGKIMTGFDSVSHCYRRKSNKKWPYNLYTMVHGKTEQECLETIKSMSSTTGIKDYVILFSCEELKKTSMIYFSCDRGKE
nr:Lrp/AsnC family transcriptional regulator [Desulfobacterales bacterium]